nr:integrase, catalytic region, zinc finger, CCHC-type, peptidase aspartic, catalytic [Tanacetum cinerariifolium]
KFVHELKQEMHADLKYVESLKKGINKLESDKAEFSGMYDEILQDLKECDCLAQKISNQTESISKEVHNELLKRFATVEKHSISLEIALQKRKDQNIAISELKKLIENGKGKSVDTKFDRPYVVRQPNAQRIPKASVLGKPTPFSNSLDRIYCQRTESVPKANVSEGLLKPVTAQTLPQTAKKAIVQLILFIVDSGCTKHMRGNLKLLCNFVEKFMGTIRLGNDQFALILGYGDLVQGNVTINRVYVEGLNHNLFSIGQFCDADLEKDIMIGLLKLKYVKDQLCSSCELSKAKISLFKSKAVPSSKRRLNLLYMDLCGPMRVASMNGKKYIMMIVDDYSRQDVYSSADADVPSQQELDMLFGPLYGEFFNTGSNPSTNIQSTSAPSTHININAEENDNDQAEEGEHIPDDKFTNPFCAPTQEVVESSSHNIGNSNVPTFNQPQVSKYRWTKDHPLEQVRGNPSRPVQTRRQLATDLEMCMYALTVSTAEPKNIKEAMADSA